MNIHEKILNKTTKQKNKFSYNCLNIQILHNDKLWKKMR